MIRRPPRSTLSSSSAASDVYKREQLLGQARDLVHADGRVVDPRAVVRGQPLRDRGQARRRSGDADPGRRLSQRDARGVKELVDECLLYTSDAADEEDSVDLGGRRI